MRQRVLLGLIAVALLGVVALFVAGSSPAQAAPADSPAYCNPCECENDNRENCQGIEFYAVYAREVRRVCTYDFYLFNGQGQGVRVMRVNENDIEDLPEFPETNTLIDEVPGVAMYKLTSGEYQINAGPDPNGKFYYLIFNYECPADVIEEGNWGG
jgi:hypothetical protein